MPEERDLVKKFKLKDVDVLDEPGVQARVVENLNYIMFKYGIKVQKDMADILGIGAPQLTRILKGEQTPTLFPCLANLKRRFDYTIDDVLFTDLRLRDLFLEGMKNDDLPIASYMKYVGLYQIYYFDTSAYKGRVRSNNNEALKSGIMYVEKDTKSEMYKVMTLFNMTKERADTMYTEELKCGADLANCRNKLMTYNDSHYMYLGELELSAKHVYINLRFEKSKDKVQMVFHRPESNAKQYIGGLGSMISVSKGRGASPCVQYIAIANASLNVSEEEIAAHLLMHYPNIKTHDSIDDLVDFTIDLYDRNDAESDRLSRLSEEQKKSLVRNYMDKVINDTIEKNLFRTVIVSPKDDDEFYHYLKRVIANMRAGVR